MLSLRNISSILFLGLLAFFISCGLGYRVNEKQKQNYLSSIKSIYLKVNVSQHDSKRGKGSSLENKINEICQRKVKQLFQTVAVRISDDPNDCDAKIIMDLNFFPQCRKYGTGILLCPGASVMGRTRLTVSDKKIYDRGFYKKIPAPKETTLGAKTPYLKVFYDSEAIQNLQLLADDIKKTP